MLVLSMTSFGRNQEPTIFFEQANDLTHLHETTIQDASLTLLKNIFLVSATPIEPLG